MKLFDELSKATPPEVELTPEVANATLVASFHRTRSRRTLLKSAVAGALGATGLMVGAGTLLLSPQVTHAEAVSGSSCTTDSIKTILSVAATAERLAVTFYTNGLKEATTLGLSGASLAAIKAAQIEEQIHELFFVANGGTPLASTFSFPHGEDTFDHLDLLFSVIFPQRTFPGHSHLQIRTRKLLLSLGRSGMDSFPEFVSCPLWNYRDRISLRSISRLPAVHACNYRQEREQQEVPVGLQFVAYQIASFPSNDFSSACQWTCAFRQAIRHHTLFLNLFLT